MFVYGAKLVERERAAVIASALDAPEEDSLLIYIWASDVDHGEVRKHAAQILYGLLPQISEDKLARVGDEWWSPVYARFQGTTIPWAGPVRTKRTERIWMWLYSQRS